MNKFNGKVEQHIVDGKQPIMGVVQEVKPLNIEKSRKFDLVKGQYGPIQTVITEQK